MSALVDGDWLQERLGDPNVRILESSVAKTSYDEAHIPGALWVESHSDLLRNGDESSGHVLTAEQFAALMRKLGVEPETTVVWYGDRHSSYAIRGFWTMQYYQHRGDVYVLDGGRERWIADGRPLTQDIVAPPPSSYPVPPTHSNADHASWEQVRAAIGDPDRVVLDTRSRDEHTGVHARARHGGRVPGAAHVEWTDATAGDNVLKSEDELRAMYEAQGVTPGREIITHCQLGIRAAHTWFVLKHVLGYDNVKLYDASWQEWGNREDTPIDTGD